MTTTLLPILQNLEACPSHADRARWVMTCPFNILWKYQTPIAQRCAAAGFEGVEDYIETTRHAVLHAVRPLDPAMASRELNQLLARAAARMAASNNLVVSDVFFPEGAPS